MKQLAMQLRSWGGRRKGAGRKPRGERAGVSHRARERVDESRPAHVTLKVQRGLWSLRSGRVVSHVMRAIAAANANEDEFRLTQFSILDDHVHALVEARDNRVLSRHVQGLAVRIARGVNAAMRRNGRVFKDRFHARVLRTPTEIRRALAYVLQNRAKHMAQLGRRIPSSWIDPLSSAAAFDGWSKPTLARYAGPPLPRARSWLLAVGWRRAGAIDADA